MVREKWIFGMCVGSLLVFLGAFAFPHYTYSAAFAMGGLAAHLLSFFLFGLNAKLFPQPLPEKPPKRPLYKEDLDLGLFELNTGRLYLQNSFANPADTDRLAVDLPRGAYRVRLQVEHDTKGGSRPLLLRLSSVGHGETPRSLDTQFDIKGGFVVFYSEQVMAAHRLQQLHQKSQYQEAVLVVNDGTGSIAGFAVFPEAGDGKYRLTVNPDGQGRILTMDFDRPI